MQIMQPKNKLLKLLSSTAINMLIAVSCIPISIFAVFDIKQQDSDWILTTKEIDDFGEIAPSVIGVISALSTLRRDKEC